MKKFLSLAILGATVLTMGSNVYAETTSYSVDINKDGEDVDSMAKSGVTAAHYDDETQTMTFDIKGIDRSETGYLYKGYITGIKIGDLEGTCEAKDTQIVIENFPQPEEGVVYDVEFDIQVFNMFGMPSFVDGMIGNPEADMILSK